MPKPKGTNVHKTHTPMYSWVKLENKAWLIDFAAGKGLSLSQFVDFWIDGLKKSEMPSKDKITEMTEELKRMKVEYKQEQDFARKLKMKAS